MKTALMLLCVLMLTACMENHQYQGPWQDSGPMLTIQAYSGTFQKPDGITQKWNWCSGFFFPGVENGDIVEFRWHEINKYETFDDRCDEYQWFRVIKKKGGV